MKRKFHKDKFIIYPKPPFPKIKYKPPQFKLNYELVEENIEYDGDIETIDDLIKLAEDNIPKKSRKYNFDLYKLHNMVDFLKELNSIVGMKELKNQVLEIIIYYLQDLEDKYNNKLHTVITGPPGVGKTMIAKILSTFFLKLGVLENDTFIKAKRSDLIAEYLGQTYIKTEKTIKKAKGGVLFIDEIYSLGNPEKRDSYSKEAIDCINEYLTEEQGNFICIVAGYAEEVENCFFNYNAGLKSRFGIKINLKKYEAEELFKIYKKKVNDENWRLKEGEISLSFFEKNIDFFKYNGRDMESLFEYTKLAHARRVFILPRNDKKLIIKKDIKKALKLFKENHDGDKVREDLLAEKNIMETMYS